jgi:DNA-binding transcriptional LysR family regulator
MELYQLRSFSMVAKLGQLTKAAERLHISQPALSAQIKALEDELGIALFERVASGMELTPAGRRLLPEAEKVVAGAQALRSRAHAIKGDVAGRVSVGTVSDPDFIRVGDLLARAIEAFPLLEIELHHEISGAAFERVRDGELDASFYYGQRTDPAITAIPLRQFAYRVVGPIAWRDQLEDASWDDVAARPWIVTPAISTHRQLAGQLFQAHGVVPSTRIEADHEAVIRSLVVTGVGMALMREDLALEAARAGELVVWGDVRLATTLEFLYLKRREKEPPLRALVDVLQQVWTPATASATT